MSIDPRALSDISYGVFIVTSACERKINGMIANSVFQVTAQPPKIAIAVNKEALSHEYILKSGRFCVQPVREGADLPFIGIFGFRTGRTFNKFELSKIRSIKANGIMNSKTFQVLHFQ